MVVLRGPLKLIEHQDNFVPRGLIIVLSAPLKPLEHQDNLAPRGLMVVPFVMARFQDIYTMIARFQDIFAVVQDFKIFCSGCKISRIFFPIFSSHLCLIM